ncbi:MAG TPA: hypothetical protein VGR06_40615 [Actinophytocola sp.]|jgi:hypothetical protein|uniref:hypothetical protein n=1 Tax=Actinophytocola sp. TaxID=1872138 RepID=UPI002E0CB992|nr:hypothetical protein [Actinophytocola sp.]
MAQGFTVSTGSLAIRIGELRSLASAVEGAATALGTTCGNLGPGELTAAVQEVSEQWSDGLGTMREKIDTMADNVSAAVDNYELIEQGGAERMTALGDSILVDQTLKPLRDTTIALSTQRDALNRAGGKP